MRPSVVDLDVNVLSEMAPEQGIKALNLHQSTFNCPMLMAASNCRLRAFTLCLPRFGWQ
jgi:hypothetical protein